MSKTKSNRPRLRVPMRVKRKALRMALGSTAGKLKFAAGSLVAGYCSAIWFLFVYALQLEEAVSAAVTAVGIALATCAGMFTTSRLLSNELEQAVMAQGLCPNCGYDVHADFSQACAKCGWQRKEKDAEQPA